MVNQLITFIMDSRSSIPTHEVATWLLRNIDNLLNHLGLEQDERIEEALYITIIVVAAFAIGWLVRWLILKGAQKMVALQRSPVGKALLQQHVMTKCSQIITPLIILGFLPFAFDGQSTVLHIANVVTTIYMLITFGIGLNSVFEFIWVRYDERDNTKNLPLKGVLNVAKGIVWIIIAIIAISIIVQKSPATLLAGLGAFAAALMLVFKDSILGFVAGIQLSQNDMLRVGDWIVVPSTIANGICVDVSLTAVKVQNWDNTIVTLPPYTLVSTSFQNWRGMSESGYRLISRSVIFDIDSVKPTTSDFVDNIAAQFSIVKPYVDKLRAAGKNDYDPGLATVNGTLETNLGLFRAYMCQYLLNHPLVGNDQQILVRLMNPTPDGWPLQIYCYTTTAWTAYEAVQSEIFEHIAAVAPAFGLNLYNEIADNDLKAQFANKN